jgi:hypothetical protein
MRFEEGALGEVVDVDVAPLLVHLVENLLEDDLALQLDFLEERTRQHVAQHGERQLEALRMDGRVVVAVIARRDAVQVATDVFHDRVERPAIWIAGAPAEEEVLEEMGNTVDARLLVARSRPYVRRQHSRVQVRELDGDDAQPVPQDGLVDGVAHAGRAG